MSKRYEVGTWIENSLPSYWCWIYVAGSLEISEQVCRKEAFPSGLCVTIEPVRYIFGGGTEDGVRVGLIQYPPFPEDQFILRGRAIRLGRELAEANYQWQYSIIDPYEVRHYSRRKD